MAVHYNFTGLMAPHQWSECGPVIHCTHIAIQSLEPSHFAKLKPFLFD